YEHMPPYKYLASHLFLFLCVQIAIHAQTFTDIRAGLTGVAESSAAWIDADRDGDPDVFVSGEFYQANRPQIEARYYNNLRNNSFRHAAAGLPHFFRGDIRFADFDLDGITDAGVMGELRGGGTFARLFKGNGNGGFAATNIQLL
ncbi:VCBS repeat-containing protein, partial [Arthrospira platensis SPKY1]|nr:VCBS repeat-containing protein [Arthrospira platensis SPKY1]